MTSIRFAIWTAVSSAAQAAPEKNALQAQLERTRAAGLGRGWQESAGPYTAAASRSYYVNLADAEADIPALRSMLEDARLNRYDVLAFDGYDRLGDLADMIAQTLRFYGKQLFSVIEPSEPLPPEQYTPYSSSAEEIMRNVHRITQHWRIQDMRLKYFKNMPARVDRGLTPLRVPYGYRWTGRKTPPVPDPEQVAVIYRIRDLLLGGETYHGICRLLDRENVPAPMAAHWRPRTVMLIATNPYYCGQLIFGRNRTVHDTRSNRVRQVPRPSSEWHTGRGAHAPLWDESTTLRLQAEVARRRELNTRYYARHAYSGLYYCGVCGAKMRLALWGRTRRVLACRTSANPNHNVVDYTPAFDETTRQIQNAIRAALTTQHRRPTPTPDPEPYKTTQAELQARRQRIQEGYESGLYTKEEAARRLAQLQTAQTSLDEKRVRSENVRHLWDEWQRIYSDPAALDRFPEWVRTDDPVAVNQLIRTLITRLRVYPDGRIEIEWNT